MTPKKVTIDRATWRSGRDMSAADFGSLLDIQGRRCCLGFLGKACGLDDADALWTVLPSAAWRDAEWPLSLRAQFDGYVYKGGFRNDAETLLTILNDEYRVDDPTRESWIAAGFKHLLGIEVEFIGSYERRAQ